MRTVLLMALLLGCKGNPVKCEQACRNYATLIYWKTADAEIAAAPVEKREALRKERLAKFTADLEAGSTMCTSRCISANNDKQIDCLIDAKTAEQASACVKD